MSDFCAPKNGGKRYDLAVIGAGSAGFSAAITAAEQGAQVALIGHGTIGGTCVNIGCVPSKTLIRAAETLHQASAAERFAGISARGRADDWRALVHQKDELVAGLRQSKYIDLLPTHNGISYMEGQARLAEGGVALNGALIKAERLIITTGARPAVPALPGIEDVEYLTSTSALALETLPKSLLVIGGGFVGAELAQMFARIGVKVTIVCRSRLGLGCTPRRRGPRSPLAFRYRAGTYPGVCGCNARAIPESRSRRARPTSRSCVH
jgi:pyruvate/2-oxoglutarate dehydrogenase complex dihydrolipoamide dehydrogenase (E3) component